MSDIDPPNPADADQAAPRPEGGAERRTDKGASHPERIPDRRSADSAPRYLKENDTPFALGWRVVMARYRAMRDKAGRDFMRRTLRIGISARIFHPEPGSTGLRSKNLQYLEESIAQWVMSRDVLVFMIPTVNTGGLLHPSNITLRHYARHLDGLVLQGGADVSPQTYSEAATRPEWNGDRARDLYELELLHEFVDAGKPVLGICRGCQLINVGFGGTLYQDIASDVPDAAEHVNSLYDSHRHTIAFPKGSTLASLFPKNTGEALVNSIHHQAVKELGRDITIEAVSQPDNIVEAIRYQRAHFVVGLQWHPEFHSAGGVELLDCTPILDNFLRAARETRF
ncbi:putative glutamine amidotransferase [Janthinobacterium sp. CG_23.3]|uniref:gamma-glutamyl-gamma-aminobutyrate hydrolase n=1 Tax=unclassified Janthinobacterium TaxID=2610881 RepID=UPI00034623B6|nr:MULTISPECIES: gamma-glutamyl-gamma-aminobutyrate hydrolase [unclassified Janthinobacterium]MEC5161735.1 putative glutamine amidotransferase [Janthinobacterium sp. CG_S6]